MAEFDERLRAPLWWWPAAAALVALLSAEIFAGLGIAVAVGVTAGLALLAAAGLIAAGRARVRVSAEGLRAGRALLPLSCVGGVQVLTPAEVRQVLGPQAQATAYVVYRGWLAGAVLVEVADPQDDTPYWVVGSRRPQQLARTLLAARLGRAVAPAEPPAAPAASPPPHGEESGRRPQDAAPD